MIRFLYEGKSCYANVYVYDAPREYHVHIVNPSMHHRLPESLILVDQNEKLCLTEKDHVPDGLVDSIADAIKTHRSG